MGDSTDPAKQQYFIFSLIIAGILSIAINFVFVDFLKDSLLYGFPFNLADASTFAAFIYRILNTIIYTLVLAVPVYYGFIWLANRTRY